MPLAELSTGITAHYEWSGPQGAPVVVFINGLLTDLHSWDGHMPHFEGYRCLRWDCRGQGSSDKPEAAAYPVAEHAHDLLALLDALELGEPVALVGLSNGGAAALQVAAEHPSRVSALVVSGAYASVDRALRVKLRSWIAAMEAGGGALRFDVATPWVWGPRFLAEHWESLLAYRDKGLALDVAVARRLIAGAMEHEVPAPMLGQIRAPTLVTVGADDVLTPPDLARAIHQAVPLARLEVMEDLGHAAALEDVGAFGRLTRRFIDAAVGAPDA